MTIKKFCDSNISTAGQLAFDCLAIKGKQRGVRFRFKICRIIGLYVY